MTDRHALVATFSDGKRQLCYDVDTYFTLGDAVQKIVPLVRDYRNAVTQGWLTEVPIVSIISHDEAQRV